MIPSFEPTPPSSSSMEAVISTEFKSWIDFKTGLTDRLRNIQLHYKADAKEPNFLFRGQSCGGWPLWSSFDRIMDKFNIKGTDIEINYLKMINDFIKNGTDLEIIDSSMALSPDETIKARFLRDPKLRRDVESFAQHHGLPTRLLDWSDSPYVAAFFGFCEPPSECGSCDQVTRTCTAKTSVVWCIDMIGAQDIFDDHDLSFVDNTGKGNRRKVWQRGSFTANWTNQIRFEDIFLKKSNKTRQDPMYPVLFKCTIPQTERAAALNDLELMRINYLSVYPDIDGLARHAKSRLLRRMQP